VGSRASRQDTGGARQLARPSSLRQRCPSPLTTTLFWADRGYSRTRIGGAGMTPSGLACPSCGTSLREAAKFCDECGAATGVAHPAAEYKQVTVLFADVVRSMDIAATVGAERLREIMTELLDRSNAVVKRYGGTVNQFTGDGIMAAFGAPMALEDHAIRACLAALGLQEAVKQLGVDVGQRDGVDLRLRVGLNSGQVIAGEIGSAAFGYTTVGEQVGMAQRMESVAPPGGIMLSTSTARLVSAAATLGEPESVHIKGSSEPVTAYRLFAVEVQSSRIGRSTTGFVGRQWEMNTIAGILDRSISGFGAVVGVAGPAGIGKSRLVSETTAIARRRGVEVFSTFCESHTSDVAFHVAARLLRDAAGIRDLDDEAARARVSAQASDAGDDDVLLLYELLGIRHPDMARPDIDPDARRRRLTALINSVWLGRTTAALYIIEDAHWIDDVSAAMIADLLTDVLQTPSTVLITYRPEYRGALANVPGAQTISLRPLSDSEITELLDEMLGPDLSVTAIRALIAGRAAGNPFFAQEMVRELADRGVFEGDRGSYRCTTDVADVSVPATLQATLAARIDRLNPRAKRTLHAAAVIGSRLDADLLASVVGSGDVAPLIEAELVEQVIVGPRAEYAFRHPLIRAVAYESQLKSDRAELHRRLAALIEQRDAGSADDNAALIAEHLDAAGDLPAAYAWHMRAGSWLMNRDVLAARVSWQRARRVADALPPGFPDRIALRIHPRTLLCTTTWRIGASADETGFDELRELCTTSGNQVSLAAGLSGTMLSLTMANRHHDSSRLASEQIALFDSADDPMSMFGVMSAAMFAKLHAGEAIEARRVAQTVIDLVADDRSKGNIPSWGLGSPLAVALLYRAHAHASLGSRSWRGDLKRAIAIQRDLNEVAIVIVITYGYTVAVTNGLLLPDAAALADTAGVLRNAEKSGDDVALALAQVAHGLLLTHAARTDDGTGVELMAKGREAQLLQRNLLTVAMVDIRTAQLTADRGDLDDAIAIARATVNELTNSGEMLIRGAASAGLVAALLMRGNPVDVDEAEDVIDQLADAPTEPRFVINDIWLMRLRALLARTQNHEAAYHDFKDRYRAMAEELGFEGHTAMADAMS
jgi:adenylate cyclase